MQIYFAALSIPLPKRGSRISLPLRGLLRRPLHITQKTLGITGESEQEASRREVTSKGCSSEKLFKQGLVKECSLRTPVKLGLRKQCAGCQYIGQQRD